MPGPLRASPGEGAERIGEWERLCVSTASPGWVGSGRVQPLPRTRRRFNVQNLRSGCAGLLPPAPRLPGRGFNGIPRAFPPSAAQPSHPGSQVLLHPACGHGAAFGTPADATALFFFYFSSFYHPSRSDAKVGRTLETLARAELCATLPWTRLRSVSHPILLTYTEGSPFCQRGVNLKIKLSGFLWGKAGLPKKEKQLPSAL